MDDYLLDEKALEKLGFEKDGYTNISPDYYAPNIEGMSVLINLKTTADKIASIYVNNGLNFIASLRARCKGSFYMFKSDLDALVFIINKKGLELTPEMLERNGFELIKGMYRLGDIAYCFPGKSISVYGKESSTHIEIQEGKLYTYWLDTLFRLSGVHKKIW